MARYNLLTGRESSVRLRKQVLEQEEELPLHHFRETNYSSLLRGKVC